MTRTKAARVRGVPGVLAGKAGYKVARGTRPAQACGLRLKPRRDLLATTALQATVVILLAFPVYAQPAPTARPQGGQVVGGQASIAQTTAQTTVQQSSQRAAIDWRSYDIGAQHTVQYQQPNSTAIVLNRVTGPDPSQIAGRIQANGQVVVTNGAGVVFFRGSQVDVQSLVVSTAGVTNQNFMAGRMVFDQAGRPDAKISNAGTITVAETGLAALVAPQVANSGTINARMGRAVLAGGAEAHTVDLYGDGLMSVDVTREVRQAPNGATALVTNTGTIVADGGSITLSARAADGILTNLVGTRGTLQANTANGRAGTVTVSAIGGAVVVEGAIHADGRAPGAAGGTVVLNATDRVALGAGARISANGQGGGGTVAVGTTAARARAQGGGVPADAARSVTMDADARISADGRGTGSGGTVALLSQRGGTVAGRISARGGRAGGDGGRVELSADRGLNITGAVDTRAPKGRTGTLTLDPADLRIGNDVSDTPIIVIDANNTLQASTISDTTFNNLANGNNINMSATNSLSLTGTAALGNTSGTAHSLTLTSTGTLGGAGTLTVSAPISQNGAVILDGVTVSLGAGVTGSSVAINTNIGVSNTIALTTGGGIGSLGLVTLGNTGAPTRTTAITLAGSVASGSAALGTPSDIVASATSITVNTGGSLISGQGMSLNTAATATGFTVNAGLVQAATTLAVNGTLANQTGGLIQAPTVGFGGFLNQTGGTIAANGLNLPRLSQGTGGTIWTRDNLSIAAATSNAGGFGTIGGTLAASGVNAGAVGSVTLTNVAAFSGNILANGDVSLSTAANQPMTLSGSISTRGNITVQQGAVGVVSAGGNGGITQTAGTLAATGAINFSASEGALSQTGGTVAATNITGVSLAGRNSLAASQTATVGTTTTLVAPSVTAAPGSPAQSVTLTGSPTSVRLDGTDINVTGALTGSTVELHASTGDISVSGVIKAGFLQGTAGYNPTLTAGALPTYDSPGPASQVALTNGGNAITTLGPFYAGGSITVSTLGTLVVADRIVAGSNTSIGIAAPGLVIDGATGAGSLRFGTVSGGAFATNTRPVTAGAGTYTPATAAAGTAVSNAIRLAVNSLSITGTNGAEGFVVDARGGSVAIAPNSARELRVGAAQAGTLSLDATTLGLINTLSSAASTGGNKPQALLLGSLDGTVANTTATQVTIDAPLTLTNTASTLGLYATGAINETATGSLTIGRQAGAGILAEPGVLTGAAGGAVTLTAGAGAITQTNQATIAPANSFDVLQGFTAAAGLSVGMTPTADSGLAGLALKGTLSSGTGDLALVSVGTGTVGGTIAVGASGVAGVADGVAALNAGANTVRLSARNGLATAAAITETAGSTITAGTLAGAASTTAAGTGYDVTLTQTGNAVGALGRFIVGTGADTAVTSQGGFALTTGGTLTVNGQVTARTVAITANSMTVSGDIGACIVGGSGGTVQLTASDAAGTIAVTSGTVGGQTSVGFTAPGLTTVSGGVVNAPTVSVGAGGLTVSGGRVQANTLSDSGALAVSAGTLAVDTSLTPATISYTGGNIQAAQALTLQAAAGAALTGTVSTTGTLTVTGAGALSSGGSLLSTGALSITSVGAFTQTGGTIGSAGAVSIASSGAGVGQTGGAVLSGSGAGTGTITFTGTSTGATSVGGTLSANTIRIIEPGRDLTISGTTVTGSATVTVGTLTLTNHCPGCDTNTTGSTQTVTQTSAGTAASLRADAATLAVGGLAATLVELHSTGATTTATGGITANVLQGTAGYALGALDAGLPTYATPSGTGGVSLTSAANAITQLGPYYAGGGIAVTSTGATTVVDRVVAGLNQTLALTADTLTVNGGTASGSLRFGQVNTGAFSTNTRPVTAGAGTYTPPTVAANATVSNAVRLTADVLGITGTNSGGEGAIVDARGGTVAIAPRTRSALLVAATGPGTALVVDPALFTRINALAPVASTGGTKPQAILLGSTDGTVGGTSAATVTIGAALTLTDVAATLGLYATGAIGETSAGSIAIGRNTGITQVGVVTGRAGGSAELTGGQGAITSANQATLTAPNSFDVLQDFTAVGSLNVAMGTGAASGLSGLTLRGQIGASGGGAVDVGLLSLGNGTAGGTIAVGSAGGAAQLASNSGTTRLVAREGSAAAAAITQNGASTVVAGTLTGLANTASVAGSGAGYNVVLDGASNLVSGLGTFAVGAASGGGFAAKGGLTLVAGTALTVSGPVNAATVALTANGMTIAGDVGACAVGATAGSVTLTAATGSVTVNSGTVGAQSGSGGAGGSVTFAGAGNPQIAGGTVNASTVAATGGNLVVSGGLVLADTVSVSGAGVVSMSAGTLAATAITAPIAFTGGTIRAGSNLALQELAGATLTGAVSTTGSLSVTGAGALTSGGTLLSGGALTIGTAGDFTQTGGTIGSSTTVSVTATGGVVSQSGGSILAGSAGNAGTITLTSQGTAAAGTIAGTLSAGTINVIETGSAVSLSGLALRGTAGVSVGSLSTSFHCPGCDTAVAGFSQATTSTPGSLGTTGLFRVDGTSVTLGAISASTIEVHATGDITQSAAITATRFQGTAGYAVGALDAGLPTYATLTAPGVGAVTLTDTGNAITQLGPLYAGGSIAVTSGGTLTVVDRVVAGQDRTIGLTADSLAVNGGTASGSLRFGRVDSGAFGSSTRPVTANAGTYVAPTVAANGSVANTVLLKADALSVTGTNAPTDGAIVDARGGTVAITPRSRSELAIGAASTGSALVLDPTLFGRINTLFPSTSTGGSKPQLLLLGSTDGTVGTTAISQLTIGGALTLTNAAATLGLYSTGAITETAAGSIAIGRNTGVVQTGVITGRAGGAIELTGGAGAITDANQVTLAAPNSFDVLQNVSSGGALNVAMGTGAASGGTGLTLQGSLTAGGDIGLVSVGTGSAGGTIAVGGVTAATVDAGANTLRLVAREGSASSSAITETAGSTLTAGTLTGEVRTASTTNTLYDVTLNQANAIGTLGRFIVGNRPDTGVTVKGGLTFTTTGALTVLGQVTARAVTLTANSMTVQGDIGACAVPGPNSGAVLLTASGAAGTIGVLSGTVGGQTSVTLAAPGAITVSGGTVNAPAVTINNLAATGGTVAAGTLTLTGTAQVSGGTVQANTLTASTASGRVGFGSGALYAGNDLDVAAKATITGQIASGGQLSIVNDAANASPGLGSAADIFSQAVTTITATTGDFAQTGGTIASNGAVTIRANVGLVQQAAAGAIESATTVTLLANGAGSATIGGRLAGATIAVSAPNADVTFAPVGFTAGDHVLRGAAGVVFTPAGTPRISGFVCPGCQGVVTVVRLGTVTATPGGFRPGALRVDGSTVTLGAGSGPATVLAADTIELHSLGLTRQTGFASLETGTLSGTAGYAATSGAGLPTYAPGSAQTRAADGSFVAAPASTAGTVVLDNALNNIAGIGAVGANAGYQVRGIDATQAGLTVVTAPAAQVNAAGATVTPTGLTVSGVVRAGAATDPLDASAAGGATGNAVNLTVGNGTTLAVNGTLAGSTVTLTAPGAVTESAAGLVVANVLTGTGGTVTLGQDNQVAVLGPYAVTGNLTYVNARNLDVTGIAAPAGTVSITARSGAGTASALEPGGTFGTGLLTIRPATAIPTINALNVALSGVGVVVNGTIGACAVPTGSNGTIVITSLGTVQVNAAAIIGAQTSVEINAPGGVFVNGGEINGPTLTFGRTTSTALTVGTLATNDTSTVVGNSVTASGPIVVNGGKLHADTLAANGGLTFVAGDLYVSTGTLALTANGTISGQIITGGNLAITGNDLISDATIYTGGSATITTTAGSGQAGDFFQRSGLIAGRTDVTVTASGVLSQAAGATFDAGGTLLLHGSGTGAAFLNGSLAAATIQLIEPNASLTFAPGAFASAGPLLRGTAAVSVSSASLPYTCPGCTDNGTTGPFGRPTATAVDNAFRPGTLRVDAGTLTIGSSSQAIGADAIELHVGAITQGASQVGGSIVQTGALETLSLTGTQGYVGSTATLPVYTPLGAGSQGGPSATGNGVNGGSVLLTDAGNAIGAVNGFEARGTTLGDGFLLATTLRAQTTSAGVAVTPANLVIGSTIRAGAGTATDAFSATALGTQGAQVRLTVNGSAGGIVIGSAGVPGAAVAGSLVQLTAPGAIVETAGGRVVAGTLVGSAGLAATLDTATSGAAGGLGNQVGTLGSFAAGQAFSLRNSRSLNVGGQVSGSTVTIVAQSGRNTAASAEGGGAGALSISGGSIVAATDVALTAYGALSGANVTAPGALSLLAGGSVTLGGIVAGSVSAIAGGDVSIAGSFGAATASGGAVTVTDSSALNLGSVSAGAGLLVSAPTITASGNIFAATDVRLQAQLAFTQTGGVVAAQNNLFVTGAGDGVAMTGALTQQAGQLVATNQVRLLSGGDASQAAGGVLAGGTVQVIASGANSFAANRRAAVTQPVGGVDVSGVVPVAFSSAAGSVALSGQPGAVRLDGASLAPVAPISGAVVELHSVGDTLVGPAITAGVLTGTAGYAASGVTAAGLPTYGVLDATTSRGGVATLANAGNDIATVAGYQARTGLTIVDAPSGAGLVLTGTVQAGLASASVSSPVADGGPLAITVTGAGKTLAIGDGSTATLLSGDTVGLTVAGALSETAGAVVAANTLSGTAATATLDQANQVSALGPFTTTGDFRLTTTPALTIVGTVQAGGAVPGGASPTVRLAVGGGLTLNGGGLTAGTVAITAGGALTEVNGVITATTLTASTARVDAGNRNQVTTLGAITAPGGIVFVDVPSLTTAGAIVASAGGITLQSGGNLVTQAAVTARDGIVLTAAGTLTDQSGSAITGGSLVAASTGAATFQGQVRASGPIQVNGGGIVVSGTVQGGATTLTSTGDLTLSQPAQMGVASLVATAAGTATIAGALSSTNDASVTAGNVTVSGVVTAGGGLVLDARTGLLQEAAGAGLTAASLTATGGTITLNGATTAGPVALTAIGPVTLSGTSSLRASTLAVGASGAATLAGSLTVDGDATVAANGLTLTGTSGVGGTAVLRAGTGALTEAASGVLTAGRLDASAAQAATLAGRVTVSGDAAVAANGIAISGPVSVGGAAMLSAGNGTLTVAAGGSLGARQLDATAAGAATFAGTATVSGDAAVAANGIAITGPVSVGGAATLAAGSGTLTVAAGGSLGARQLDATAAGAATFAGTATVSADARVAANGIAISGPVTVGGAATLSAGSGTFAEAAGGSLTAQRLDVSAAGAATFAGTTTVSNDASVRATGIGVTGPVSVGGAATLDAGSGTLTESTGGSLVAGMITAAAGGAATLSGTVTSRGTLDVAAASIGIDGATRGTATTLTARGPVTLSGGSTLDVSSLAVRADGAASFAGRATVAGATTVTANGIAVAGTLASGGPLGLSAGTGALTEAAGGRISGAGITIAAGDAASLAGSVSSGGDLAVAAGSITVAGTTSAVGAAGLRAGADLTIARGGSLTAAAVSTAAGGTTTIAGTLTSSGAATLASGAILVPGTLTGGTALTLTSTGGTVISGILAAPTVSVTGAGIAVQSNGVAPPVVQVGGGTIDLNALGGALSVDAILQASNRISLRTDGAATLGSNGRLVAETQVTIGGSTGVRAASAVLAGRIDTPRLRVDAGTITIAGGSLRVGGPAVPAGSKFDTLPTVTNPANGPGAFFEAQSAFSMTGPYVVTSRTGNTNVVRVDLTGDGGTIKLGTLDAAETSLVLSLGSGTATGGQIRVSNLFVDYTGVPGQGPGIVDLSGTVGVQSGTAAAGAAQIAPAPSQSYRFNACAIGSVNCVVLRPQVLPVGNPLKEQVLNFFREQDDQTDLLVPNTTDQGL